MNCVILESPYAGATPEIVARHEDYARRCMLDCLNRGEAPIASHLLYTQVLSDNNPTERALGIDAGLAWYKACDKVVFYMDLGFSPGMQAAELKAIVEGKRMERRFLTGYWQQ